MKKTILYIAVKNSNYTIANELLTHEANVNVLDINNTSLHNATKNNNYYLVNELLTYSADINIQSHSAQTALSIAYNELLQQDTEACNKLYAIHLLGANFILKECYTSNY